MLEQILHAWRGRRVLLAGEQSSMLFAMEAQLLAIGARPVRFSFPSGSEALCRALQQERTSCILVPDLRALHSGSIDDQRLALDMLLHEAREAGVPLAVLLSMAGKADAPLLRQAEGFMHGAFGDPISIQSILHSLPPQMACIHALRFGARFFCGDTACTGTFDLRRLRQTNRHAAGMTAGFYAISYYKTNSGLSPAAD